MNPGGPVSEEESFRCERHSLTTSGFCPSCLSERLTCSHSNSSTCRPNDAPHYHNNNRDEIRVSEDDDDDLEKDILEMEAQIDAIVNNFKSINIQQHNNNNNQKPNHFWSNWGGRKQKKTTVASSHRESQSEVADYGFGRRSCDITGPRFSLDIPTQTQTQTPREYSSKGLIQRSTSMRAPSVSVINNNNQNATKVSPTSSMDIYNRTHRLNFHSIGGENELQTDDSSVNKKKKTTTPQRWWTNLKVKVWGSSSSSNNTRIRKLTRSSSWINNKPQRHHFHSDNNNPPPNHVNNGFLRFYLTPLRASRRSGTGAFMSSKPC